MRSRAILAKAWIAMTDTETRSLYRDPWVVSKPETGHRGADEVIRSNALFLSSRCCCLTFLDKSFDKNCIDSTQTENGNNERDKQI